VRYIESIPASGGGLQIKWFEPLHKQTLIGVHKAHERHDQTPCNHNRRYYIGRFGQREKPHEKSEGRTPSGWSKELEDNISAQRLFSQNEDMLLRLTMGLPRDCIGPESALNILQK
jgi:hypothetical protein